MTTVSFSWSVNSFDSVHILDHKAIFFFLVAFKTPHFVFFLLSYYLLHSVFFILPFSSVLPLDIRKPQELRLAPFVSTMHQSMNQLKKRSLETGSMHLPEDKNQCYLKALPPDPWGGPVHFGAEAVLHLVSGLFIVWAICSQVRFFIFFNISMCNWSITNFTCLNRTIWSILTYVFSHETVIPINIMSTLTTPKSFILILSLPRLQSDKKWISLIMWETVLHGDQWWVVNNSMDKWQRVQKVLWTLWLESASSLPFACIFLEYFSLWIFFDYWGQSFSSVFSRYLYYICCTF